MSPLPFLILGGILLIFLAKTGRLSTLLGRGRPANVAPPTSPGPVVASGLQPVNAIALEHLHFLPAKVLGVNFQKAARREAEELVAENMAAEAINRATGMYGGPYLPHVNYGGPQFPQQSGHPFAPPAAIAAPPPAMGPSAFVNVPLPPAPQPVASAFPTTPPAGSSPPNP
jgi:hypothetical protein